MMHRHLSEPDAKAIREIERDLQGLKLHDIPETPPFGGLPGAGSSVDDLNLFTPGTEQDISAALGMPTDLTYAKTTPLHLEDEAVQRAHGDRQHGHHGQGPYDAVNDPFFDRHRRPPEGPYRGGYPYHHQQPPPRAPLRGAYPPPDVAMGTLAAFGLEMGPPFVVPPRSKAGGKSKRKKKGKQKKESKSVAAESGNALKTGSEGMGGVEGPNAISLGFDFAIHDLNEQLTMLGKDTMTVDQEIDAVDSKVKAMERTLKRTEIERKRVLKELEMERMVLRKSLGMSPVDDAGGATIRNQDVVDKVTAFGATEIEEYWSKHCESLKRDIAHLESQNQAISAASDVTHNALRSQLEAVRKQVDGSKAERASHRNKNMQSELEVIELSEKVNALRESLDFQKKNNFQRINKERERRMRERERKRVEELERAKRKRIKMEKQRKRRERRDAEDAKADLEIDGEDDDGDGDEEDAVGGRSRAEVLNVTRVRTEYPSENAIRNNLVRAQVEFYFSDYNLKRDKRLLEKICKEPQRGYLATLDVLGLSRVRQLVSADHELYEALESSPYIDLKLNEEEKKRKVHLKAIKKGKAVGNERERESKEDETDSKGDGDAVGNGEGEGDDDGDEMKVQYHPLFVGRARFSPPMEKQFPFRRSVYLYGLPWYADEKYIFSMLQAFGGVTKVQFDHGPDTLDRLIMAKMLEKHRVYKLLSKDSAALTMEFNAMSSKQETYDCYWCQKRKPCADGYYHPQRAVGQSPSYRVCLQCAAAKSEQQSAKYDSRRELLRDDKRLRELLLGLPPRAVSRCKTALCVFASQRQASKCVYVRSRLAYDGAFATHYHHYSKLKKEIALCAKGKKGKEGVAKLVMGGGAKEGGTMDVIQEVVGGVGRLGTGKK